MCLFSAPPRRPPAGGKLASFDTPGAGAPPATRGRQAMPADRPGRADWLRLTFRPPAFRGPARTNSQSEIPNPGAPADTDCLCWLIRFLGTSVFLGGSAPKPPAFAAFDQWHEEHPGSALWRERPWPRRAGGTAAVEDSALLASTLSAAAVQWHGRCERWRWHRLASIMLLAQTEKCQGCADSIPGLCLVSVQKVPKNRMSRNNARDTRPHYLSTISASFR